MTSDDTNGNTAQQPIPEARVVRSSRPSLAWLLPIIAAVVVGVIYWQGASSRGPAIEITFPAAHGLRTDDSVVFRGVPVGVVRAVRLDPDGAGVLAEISLSSDAAMLALAGTRFWIVRPELSLTRVAGLDTLVGPRYIQADRFAPQDGDSTLDEHESNPVSFQPMRFAGLPEPPQQLNGGLGITLETERVSGVSPGTAIRYRGVRVGEVRAVDLADGSNRVHVRAVIEPAYAHLVRTDSRFWIEGGTGVDFGWLSGFSVRSAPLESILTGEISFATRSGSSPAPTPDMTFVLADEPDRAWLEWSPDLRPTGEALAAP